MQKSHTAFATFDGAEARAYLYERMEKKLTPLPGFPMGGEHKVEFADKRPRVFQSAGSGRSATEPATDPEKSLERQFVADVAAQLDILRRQRAFEHLIVAAAPRALGYWRAVAPKDLAAAVKKELPADHVHSDDTTILPVVEDAFFG